MCSTPYCYGDCPECVREQNRKKEYEERSAECPYNLNCKIKTASIKQDVCTTCGKIWNY